MRRLFLTLGVMVAVCIILISFSKNSLQVKNNITKLDSISAIIPPLNKKASASVQIPFSVQRNFKASGYEMKSIIEAKEVNSADGKVYEFILLVNNDKWHLKYDEKGQLLDSNKVLNKSNFN